MGLPPQAPEACASAYSATSAAKVDSTVRAAVSQGAGEKIFAGVSSLAV